MKKTKILTVLGVLLAMGITACGGKTKTSSSNVEPPASSDSSAPAASDSTPAASDSTPAPSASVAPDSSSTPAPSSSSVEPGPQKDATGHIWGADADVEASNGGVAYKLAACSEGDDFKKITVNQSNVTLASGSARKNGTPDGYLKLDKDGNSCSFKFNYDSYAVGKLFLYSCMDGWKSNYSKNAFYYNGSPNIEIRINGKAMDLTPLANVVYTDFLGGDTEASYSEDGYGLIGDIVIHEGLNEISYKRVQTMNTLVKDFVLVIKNEEHTHQFSDWADAKTATCTEIGSQTRSCACGIEEQRDVNTLPHELDAETEVEKRNTDGKKVMQYDCKTGNEKVAAMAMNQVSDIVNTVAVDGQKEKWDIGASANKAAADTYKLDKGTALLFKVGVSEDVNNAFLSIGATYTNPRERHFYNEGDRTDTDTNGDNPNDDAYRYYTKVNDGDFTPIAFNSLMSDIFGDGSEVRYMPLGKFNLKAGENLIYIRQGNLGYRVTMGGNLYIALNGNAIVSGDSPTHTHQAATEWTSDENTHWHACIGAGTDCDEPNWKDSEAAHTFGEQYDVVAATCTSKGSYKVKCSVCDYIKTVETDMLAHTFGEWTQVSAPTCEAPGSEKRTCSVCNEVEIRTIAKLAHNFGDVVASNPAGDGVATTVRNCSLCEKAAYRWSALDFDRDLSASTSVLDVKDTYVRFGSGTVENSGTATAAPAEQSAGSHIVYKVEVPEAVENAGLSFNIRNTGGNSNVANVFDPVPNDNSHGYVYKDGEFTHAQKRYGLRVNGVEYYLGEDTYGPNNINAEGWFDWPVNFPLQAGVNVIDVFPYLGYRAQLKEFQLTGLPKVEASHTHVLSDWQSDETNHWKICSGENCPAGEGAHLEEAAHTFGEQYDVVAATCTSKGSYKVKCSVCEYVKTVETPMLDHAWGDAQTAVGDAIPHECSACHTVGYELAIPSPSKLKADVTWNITGLAAGNYEIHLNACASASTLTQKFDSRYQFKVGEGQYIGASDDNATYGSYGLGTGEAAGNCKWSSTINTIEVGEGATSFTIHWTNKGYSAFISAIRLVKIPTE